MKTFAFFFLLTFGIVRGAGKLIEGIVRAGMASPDASVPRFQRVGQRQTLR